MIGQRVRARGPMPVMSAASVRRTRWRVYRPAAWLLALGAALPLCVDAQDHVIELNQAVRVRDGIEATVHLPDSVFLAPAEPSPVNVVYRIEVDLGTAPRSTAVYFSGLVAQARVSLNGQVFFDRSLDPGGTPRMSARIRLIDIPDAFVHPGLNLLQVEAHGGRFVSLSPVVIGPRSVIAPRYQWRILKAVVAPAVIAVVVGSLAVCLLLLWARRRDSLYGYFGLGSLGWALHTAWWVSPYALLSGVHGWVWRATLYSGFVSMLVVFCLHFAGRFWRRVDQTLVALAILTPLVLYGSTLTPWSLVIGEAWMLLWITIVSLGLVIVARFALSQRNVNGALLLLTGAVSLCLAVHDWLLNHGEEDNNPVFLVSYAGLMFVVLVAWMLIDRFVDASRELETMNAELEQRVALKSAELGAALGQMREAKELAESANHAKSAFLAAASHDLRQPIHALALYMEALDDDALTEDHQQVVLRMKASLTALESMFNALLDVSRMDAGAVVPALRPFSLDTMLHRLAGELAPRAAEKGLRLSVRIAPAPAGYVALSDPVLVERIALNLLSNAVKYTVHGGVLLSCRLRAVAGSNDPFWRIEVWDTGPGIGDADRERIFDEFYQVGNPQRDRAKGLGLGLSIVRRLSDLLQLPLRLHTIVGRGSRFAFDIPGTYQAVALARPAEQQHSLAGLTVAVIDDDPEVRDSMQTLLQRWGCDVHAGVDEFAVLEHLDMPGGRVPQAIIADYRLREGRTGVEAIHALCRAYGRLLPALIVSGDSSPEQLARMQASGFECMSKPVTPIRLRGWLSVLSRAALATAGVRP